MVSELLTALLEYLNLNEIVQTVVTLWVLFAGII